MDKTIDIYVNGSYMRKNSNAAGIQGEGNVTNLHITFDESWAGAAKSVTFWDALGENPVTRTLTNDLLVDLAVSLLEYSVPIPAEPLAHEGYLTFVIDGYLDGKRKRSVQDTLFVEAALIAETEGEPVDPTPTQAEQLQTAIEAILPRVQEETIKAQTAADIATEQAYNAEQSAISAQNDAQTASEAATSATASKEAAAASATTAVNAKTAAEEAWNKTESAAAIVVAAENTATQAATTASEAAQIATAAKNEVVTSTSLAVSSATIATTKAQEASESANKALGAEMDALLAKSYAVGGTGIRAGEALDNAKFYCEQAQAVVGGDYVTNVEFEDRVKDVVVPLVSDVELLDDKVTVLTGNVTVNEEDIEALQIEAAALHVKDTALEAEIVATKSIAQAVWDAVFNDITGNPTLVDFDDLTGISLTGGVWNKPLRRLEV